MFFHKKSKNAAKMNKIVQKWQFWMTFYTTMKMEVGISLNGPNKWFPPYWFLIAQHMKYPKIIMRAPVHFFWVVTTLGLQWVLTYPERCWCLKAIQVDGPLRPLEVRVIEKLSFIHDVFGNVVVVLVFLHSHHLVEVRPLRYNVSPWRG